MRHQNYRLLEEAFKYYGLKEVRGSIDNPVVLDMLQLVDKNVNNDEVAWCSAYLNYVCWKAGFERSNSLVARSWLKVGKSIAPLFANLGDVAVLWRGQPNSWKGHAGFLIKMDSRNIWLLGGNQDNMVNVRRYARSRVIDFRRLKVLSEE